MAACVKQKPINFKKNKKKLCPLSSLYCCAPVRWVVGFDYVKLCQISLVLGCMVVSHYMSHSLVRALIKD